MPEEVKDARFHSMPVSILGLEVMEKVREAYAALGMLLDTQVEVSKAGNRELSLAITNLEQSSMWAVKAIVRKYPPDPKNQ